MKNNNPNSSSLSSTNLSLSLDTTEQGLASHQSGEQSNVSEDMESNGTDSNLNKKPIVKWEAIATAAALLLVAGIGFRLYQTFRQEPQVAQEAVSPTRLPVRAANAEVSLAQHWVFDEGLVGSVRRRVLNFEVNGEVEFITQVNGRELKEGDTVFQGQLLASVDDRNEVVAIDTAEADLNVAIQQRDQAKAQLRQAQAELGKARSDLALQETELERYESLFEGGAVAAIDRDVEYNDVQQARAAVSVAAEEILVAEDGVRSAQASVEAAQARLRETKVNFEDTQLISPIDGIVAYINIREGEYWDSQRLTSAGNNLDDVADAAPIVVVDPQSFEVEIELQADEAASIRVGQTAYVVLEENVSEAEATGATNRNLLEIAKAAGSRGEVFAVSPALTPGGRGVKVNIRNFDLLQTLRVGGRAYVWVETASNPNAVMIPLGSLQPTEQGTYVFVVDEATGTVERRQVEVGIEALNGIEILNGIEPGERVVTDGVNRVVDGTLVEIVAEEEVL
ncbi:MAG: HlyD family efflux transporter periplasmic adaptor subunit [Cyanothece sp. SIO2G6]|nr:HlyD family efflux transporter periplasmic adaptor subunit [Cyanothece sp. SIO2G6]